MGDSGSPCWPMGDDGVKASGNFDVMTFRYQFQVPSDATPVDQRGFDALSLAASLALVQGGADPGEQLLARPVAAVRHGDVGRALAAHHALGRPQRADARHDEGLVALGVGVRARCGRTPVTEP